MPQPKIFFSSAQARLHHQRTGYFEFTIAAIGDTIRARLTCKRKVDRNRTDEKGVGQGVVAWDVQVTNQNDELVASYDILTLVMKRSLHLVQS